MDTSRRTASTGRPALVQGVAAAAILSLSAAAFLDRAAADEQPRRVPALDSEASQARPENAPPDRGAASLIATGSQDPGNSRDQNLDVAGREPGWSAFHPWAIAALVSLCFVQTLLIAGMIVQWSRRARVGRRPYALASTTDVSRRRDVESELRESQAALRELTGKLLGTQEAERRRIARELHDDLGQSLALLSVELDLLHQQPPKTPSQLGPRMAALAAHVRQLSSCVHELSHRLHPMKLEQLGLVAAVRGLCKELMQSRELTIEFVHEQVPEAISQDAALCLYRIAQEGLWNVIKHSQARHAGVELRGGGDAISLEIYDDGVGFDLSFAADGAGLGLASMRERMRLVDGEIAIQAQSGRGTKINARVPLGTTSPTAVELPAGCS